MINGITLAALLLVTAIIAGLATYLIVKSRYSGAIIEKNETELKAVGLQKELEYKERELSAAREEFEKRMADAKEMSDKAMQRQIEAVKAQLSSENEKLLKARQEEFSKSARESFSTIAGDFNKNLLDMKTAFEANKKTQTESATEFRTNLEAAVRNLKDQTENIGRKADTLASALRGQNKMQGCWGETQLWNILTSEGLQEGRDFDREETLRDELGIVLHNEETGKRMRPDFILHYPDNTDIIVDCKVSLNALSDYISADNETQKEEAAQRNLKAVNDQVEGLSRKDYSRYLKPGHHCLDYTVMFVPNVNALVLARQKDPLVVAKAFRKGVLITSEETFIPFLNLVRAAWVNTEQARNQELIIKAAERMVDRVSDFCAAYATIGRKLDEARDYYQKGKAKIADEGQSILKAAHDISALGVKGKKELPALESVKTPEL